MSSLKIKKNGVEKKVDVDFALICDTAKFFEPNLYWQHGYSPMQIKAVNFDTRTVEILACDTEDYYDQDTFPYDFSGRRWNPNPGEDKYIGKSFEEEHAEFLKTIKDII